MQKGERTLDRIPRSTIDMRMHRLKNKYLVPNLVQPLSSSPTEPTHNPAKQAAEWSTRPNRKCRTTTHHRHPSRRQNPLKLRLRHPPRRTTIPRALIRTRACPNPPSDIRKVRFDAPASRVRSCRGAGASRHSNRESSSRQG